MQVHVFKMMLAVALLASLFLVTPVSGQGLANPLKELVGTWKIDLRPTPEAAPVLENFVIERVDGNRLEGRFYGSKVQDAYINQDWPYLLFGFTSKDRSNSYSGLYGTLGRREGINRKKRKAFFPKEAFLIPSYKAGTT